MSTLRQKLGRCYPLQIEFVSLFLLLIVLYFTFTSYSSLPETIPTHFNYQGLPDNWSDKNSIFVYPIMSIIFYVLLTFVTVLIAVSRDPRRYINLPSNWKEGLTEAQVERLRLVLCRAIVGLKLVIQGLTVYLLYGAIEVAMGRAKGLGEIIYLFTIVILVIIGYMLWQSYKITRKQGSS